MKYKIEKTSIDEKETFIHIDNKEKSVELATNDAKVYNRLVPKIGEPHLTFPPVIEKNNTKNKITYISGCSWKYNYFQERDNIKPIFSITNLLPRGDSENE